MKRAFSRVTNFRENILWNMSSLLFSRRIWNQNIFEEAVRHMSTSKINFSVNIIFGLCFLSNIILSEKLMVIKYRLGCVFIIRTHHLRVAPAMPRQDNYVVEERGLATLREIMAAVNLENY